MALEQHSTLYEVLARFDSEGRLAGCHKVEVTRIIDTTTGTTISESLGIAVGVDAAEAADLILLAVPAPVAASADEDS